MIKSMTFAVLASASFSTFAGSAQAVLKCQSDKGNEGTVPGDETTFKVTIAKDGKTVAIYSEIDQTTGAMNENADLSTISAPQDSVWTLNANRKATAGYGFLQMYAMPKTVKYKSTPGGYKTSFTAKAYYNFSEIRVDSINAIVKCTLDYQI